MQKWEYWEVYTSGADIYVNQQKLVPKPAVTNLNHYPNQLGSQGWEMVGIAVVLTGNPMYLFKRPKP